MGYGEGNRGQDRECNKNNWRITVLRRKELSQSTKMKVVNATMMPVLMYGCETWRLTKKQQSKVQATQMNVLRRTEGVNRLDRVRNADIRERLNQEGV